MFRNNVKQNTLKSSANTRISSLVASHVSCPFSFQLGLRWTANSRFLSVGERRFSIPYSAQIGGKPSDPTLISSVSAGLVPRQ